MSSVPVVAVAPLDASIVESVLLQGDLSRLTPAQRVAYYKSVCDSVGLNHLTKPFDYLNLSGKLTLYAKRDATDQLRKIHGVSIVEISSREVGGVFVVTAKAQDKQQRIDVSTGAVAIAKLAGEALANALMKAETKAKRRVTLSICGLGMLDETEIETIPRAKVQATATAEVVNTETGEIVEAAPALPPTPDLPDDPPSVWTGVIACMPSREETNRRTGGKFIIFDFKVDEQVMSTTNKGIAEKVAAFAGQRATVTYKHAPSGALTIKSIAAETVNEAAGEPTW